MNTKIAMTRLSPLLALLLLAGCTSIPTGPSVMVLPGTGQSIERFRADDVYCRDFALDQIGGRDAEQAGRRSAVSSAAVGTAVGVVAGAALGGRDGAAVGAGSGLLVGSAIGADKANRSQVGTQRQYDHAYIQCMYTKGHRVPVPASMAQRPVKAEDAGIPPPPAGLPPAPPPGAVR